MTREQAKREIDSLDYYLQNHTDDYSEESHTAMMMAISALSENKGEDRPKGKWIYWSDSPFRWECDKCGGLFKTDFNFCPNCGADMRGK